MRKYDAVFFDAANTLLYPFPSVGVMYAQVAARYGVSTDAAAVQGAFRHAWRQMQTLAQHDPVRYGIGEPDGRRFWHALVYETFTHIAVPADFEAFFDELYWLFAQPTAYRIFPEGLAVLQRLRQQAYIVGVISNWDIRLLEILRGLDLMPYFDHVSISAVVGWEKPHDAIFQHATAAVSVQPGRAVHVGDSLPEDVQGAEQAGLQPLWLQRQGTPQTHYPVIRDLSGVLTWLEANG
ncbi:MAG: HAD-IA family hydrolase [Candidatus Tectomicrobia bacterium]|jgi:putative hydrolase of the HAD superfamily